MVMLADDKMLKRVLAVLTEWCVKWLVKVNVNKCGKMHMRKKVVKRSGQKFVMNGEVVQYVAVGIGS